ncbi:TraX family protein [Methylobacter sp. BBA5.1]|uniref:TraX family protein n=1 Tax=Methylobacter sp. BBA5.1 TaxID=1495064 RepID=UPI0009DFDFF4|nr:TraX family protein [Methylobacter sp. BBA5.1]
MKPMRLSDGTVEALKWLGLILMTGDHVNKYLFNATLPVLFESGRLCLPIFVFVLAYNLARPDALVHGVYTRTMKRLAIFGIFASVPFIALNLNHLHGWPFGPLNVLFTLLVITVTAYLVEKGGIVNWVAAFFVFLLGGCLVEYWWPAVALGLTIWMHYKKPSWITAFFALLFCASLWFINKNLWAMAALALIMIAAQIDLSVPRLRRVFYFYYPLHLAMLWLIRIPMSKVGYLVF